MLLRTASAIDLWTRHYYLKPVNEKWTRAYGCDDNGPSCRNSRVRQSRQPAGPLFGFPCAPFAASLIDLDTFHALAVDAAAFETTLSIHSSGLACIPLANERELGPGTNAVTRAFCDQRG